MQPVQPILTAPLFSELNDHLIDVLSGLTDDEWQLPTTNASWSVKDVAAHLLDGDLRRLSLQRDRHLPPPPEGSPDDPSELLAYLNRLNADWITAATRLSPRVITELLRSTGPQVAELFTSLDPAAPAIFPVGWAGDAVSPNWFDVARELTEKWIHQQQIRQATSRDSLDQRRYLFPVLDTFLRALPYAYRNVEASDGTTVGVTIEGQAGGAWCLRRDAGSWTLYQGTPEAPAAVVNLGQDTAWRFFSTRKRKPELVPLIRFEGDRELGEGVLGTTSVMA